MEAADSGLRYRLRRAARQIADQHRHIRALDGVIGAALAAGARDEVREALGRYGQALAAHFELEDAVFFPALHGLHPESRGELTRLAREHRGLLRDLRALESLLARELASFHEAFGSFRTALASHEAHEEQLAARLSRSDQGRPDDG